MRLIDCFTKIFCFVGSFLRSVESLQPPLQGVRDAVVGLIAESEANLAHTTVGRNDYQSALFAVCAWVDEAMAGSLWEHRHLWLREQLQRLHFNTTRGGEEFFERLDSLGKDRSEVREVYYFCLALGFSGRFCSNKDQEKLRQLQRENLETLLGSCGDSSLEADPLFDSGKRGGPEGERLPPTWLGRFSLAALAGMAAPLLLFGLLYALFKLLLAKAGADFLRMMGS